MHCCANSYIQHQQNWILKYVYHQQKKQEKQNYFSYISLKSTLKIHLQRILDECKELSVTF